MEDHNSPEQDQQNEMVHQPGEIVMSIKQQRAIKIAVKVEWKSILKKLGCVSQHISDIHINSSKFHKYISYIIESCPYLDLASVLER